jgi:hypothetical protein
MAIQLKRCYKKRYCKCLNSIKQLKLFNLTSKDLIDYTKNLGYSIYKIYVDSNETDDHICIPVEDKKIQLDKYPYTISQV